MNERIANYFVKLGFGVSLGWSIEGAIGSAFKIDASYLSSNVNTASKYEERTKEYGVWLIFSESTYEFMSEASKNRVRPIDSIFMKGFEKPGSIYNLIYRIVYNWFEF